MRGTLLSQEMRLTCTPRLSTLHGTIQQQAHVHVHLCNMLSRVLGTGTKPYVRDPSGLQPKQDR